MSWPTKADVDAALCLDAPSGGSRVATLSAEVFALRADHERLCGLLAASDAEVRRLQEADAKVATLLDLLERFEGQQADNDRLRARVAELEQANKPMEGP